MYSSGQLKKQPPGCSVRKGVLRYIAKFTGKHLCLSLFFNKAGQLLLQLVISNYRN